MLTFSGLVCVARLRTFGSSSGTVCVITGIVIMNTISSTNMTSTSGVVLISDIARSSSCAGGAFIAAYELISGSDERCALLANRRARGRTRCSRRTAVDACTAHQIRVQVGREEEQILGDVLTEKQQS